MADKRIDELEAASSVTANDLFVLEQAGTAKRLTSQILENWLLALAQGRGGIVSIAKTGSAGTDPVVDTYTITFSDTSTTTFDVTNGLKGDTGAQTYVYIKYSTREPIADSDLTDTPSAWMGICATTAATAPTAYGSYSWYEIKGAKGDPGNDITITSTSVQYQAWTSGTQYPTGTWENNPPAVTPGNYLWTRTIVDYSDGGQTVSYSVSRWGMDGSGAVASVNNQLPDQDGNVTLTPNDVGAMPESYQPPVTSVNNKTGTVVLGNEDVNAPYGKSVSADLSAAGWYRVLKFDNTNSAYLQGATGAEIDLHITRRRTNAVEETHTVKILFGYNDIRFADECSACSNASYFRIDKVRYTYASDGAYIDIHANAACPAVAASFEVYTESDRTSQYSVETLQSVADAPSGETILASYNFTANIPDSGAGYQMLPDGTMIQWGAKGNISFSNTNMVSGSVQMSKSFVDSNYIVTASPLTTGVNSYLFRLGVNPETADTFNWTLGSGDSASITITNRGFNWIAVGRWK